MWQGLHEELKDRGFVVITVALDKTADDARPWIEAAAPTHPSLIDTRHVLAELYHVVNVPTVVWIDERGRIVRPNDVAFGADTFRHLTGLDSSIHLAALRAWVRGEQPAFAADEARARQTLPTEADQQARAEFGLGQWLWAQGRTEAATRHFERGGELAPHDFTIRRGTMPMRGIDPMGPEFRAMRGEWASAGHPYYRPLPDTAGKG
ncbi:MAG: TlpA family protein disulfide reductase [Candidatus Rokubacteria bacterium]|nr:TlpA family protein disulfide reductase [Candidatus Rokubacteria bacterium]